MQRRSISIDETFLNPPRLMLPPAHKGAKPDEIKELKDNYPSDQKKGKRPRSYSFRE
jgi:hypothetical protein